MKRLVKACQVGRANDFANLVIFALASTDCDWWTRDADCRPDLAGNLRPLGGTLLGGDLLRLV